MSASAPRQLCAASGGVRELPETAEGDFPLVGKCSLKIHHRDTASAQEILFRRFFVSTPQSIAQLRFQMYQAQVVGQDSLAQPVGIRLLFPIPSFVTSGLLADVKCTRVAHAAYTSRKKDHDQRFSAFHGMNLSEEALFENRLIVSLS